MFTVVTSENEIEELQEVFERTIRRVAATKPRTQVLGYPGGTFEAEVFYIKKFDLWVGFQDFGNRFGNACGIGYPFENASPAPHLEINVPKRGIDRRIAGAFVTDGKGDYFLAHSGKVGGGTRGVSLTNFHSYYPAQSSVDWGGVQKSAYIVGAIDDAEIAEKLYSLTRASKEFREYVRNGGGDRDESSKLANFRFAPEFVGTKTYSPREQVIAVADHGRVVKALREELRRRGVDAYNNIHRDLFVPTRDGKDLRALFEVKTLSDTGSLYTAIGQLYFHGLDSTLRVAALPDDLREVDRKRLEELDIRVVTFSKTSTGVSFKGLAPIVAELGKV